MDQGQGQDRTVPLNFTNFAYLKLADMGTYYGVSQENLGDLLIKGLKVLQAAKDAGTTQVTIDRGGQKQVIDIREV